MSKWIIDLATYLVQHPLVYLFIFVEVAVLAYLLRIRKKRKERAIRLKKEQYQRQIDNLYSDITNPKWTEKGGKMLSYQDTKADLTD